MFVEFSGRILNEVVDYVVFSLLYGPLEEVAIFLPTEFPKQFVDGHLVFPILWYTSLKFTSNVRLVSVWIANG